MKGAAATIYVVVAAAMVIMVALAYYQAVHTSPPLPSTMLPEAAACDITLLHETVQACSRECMRAAVKLHCPGAP